MQMQPVQETVERCQNQVRQNQVRQNRVRKVAAIWAIGLVLGSVWVSPLLGNAVQILGQTSSMNLRVDGTRVPSGTTLLSPSVLETSSEPARILLHEGQVLGLDKETRAQLQLGAGGNVEIIVDGGSVATQNAAGDWVTAFANQRLVFVQAAQSGSGGSGASPVVATGGCSVNSSGGCSSSDGSCAGKCECVKTDPATGACEQCSCVPIVEPSSKSGLSTAAKVGIGVGAAAGIYLLIDELDDDDEEPASPVN
ncbi:MAG: hypothetical protein AAF560_17525 [Acidobacteriota bacterium]